MSYKLHRQQIAYQLRWVERRRKKFLKGKKCERCGSRDHLTYSKRDSKAKLAKISWSWSEERLRKELRNRRVLCFLCMTRNRKPFTHGGNGFSRGCRCRVCRWAASIRERWQRLVHGRRS
jgi:hypothetical protein